LELTQKMTDFSDPENVNQLISQFATLESKEEIQKFIDENLPGWLVASTDAYSSDYPHLQQNWRLVCRMNNVRPQKIVVVERIDFGDNYRLVQSIAETMTKRGYVVRRKVEFTGCEVCRKAIPVIEVWSLLKEKGMPVPRVWSASCSGCEASNVAVREE